MLSLIILACLSSFFVFFKDTWFVFVTSLYLNPHFVLHVVINILNEIHSILYNQRVVL